MKVYIHTDIEGVAGWVFYVSQSKSIENYYHTQRMNQLLTNEVKAAAQAAIDGGADTVLINDSHGCCYNILFEQLPKQCQIVHGRPGHFDSWLGGFDSSIDALVCIGMHAMAGTMHSVCPHTRWHINGAQFQLSEGLMAAALAGYHNIPCVCISGDDKVCAEFSGKIFGIETAIVKWGIAAQNARSLVPSAACELIYDSVKTGLTGKGEIQPFKIPGPYRINVSNIDPEEMILQEDVSGDDLWETVHRLLNSTPYGEFGIGSIDYESYRWPE